MPRIVKIVYHIERQAVTICEPLDYRGGAPSGGVDDGRICLPLRLPVDVSRKKMRAVGNPLGPLKAGARGRNEPSR